uniref:Uncharacterized protein n=2 Tax=Oryza sativa subsp. japonica TaxID=39947 RepID=A0A5S6RBF9_ORYSJ|nr:Hypothetical protein [Oryza sativa]AAL25192.1 Hypothetical protein [Oryza sativa]AAP52096.1 hypothetical protein LOC_Os10g05470 [Oryza sativa Japonica Group]
MEIAVREIATYWFEDQRTCRIISRTPMEIAVREIATYWFEDQRASTIISRTPMELAVREIPTYWFKNQRASRIISRTPMEVAVREIATYWFENQRASRIISRTPMEEIATYWFENQLASRIISRTPMEVCYVLVREPASCFRIGHGMWWVHNPDRYYGNTLIINLLSQEELDLKQFLNRLAMLLKDEEIKWYQRDKVKDLLEDDSNTKYFQFVANGWDREKDGWDGMIEGILDEPCFSLERHGRMRMG